MNVTQQGIECQRWDSQLPHAHRHTDPSTFPDATLRDVANYCRAPNGDYFPWCYTTSATPRWDYCDVDKIYYGMHREIISITYWGISKIVLEIFYAFFWNIFLLFFFSFKFGDSYILSDYRLGAKLLTSHYLEQWWTSPLIDAFMLFEISWWENTFSVIPITLKRYWTEFCISDISSCELVNISRYAGTQSVTSSGRTCQRWDSQTPYSHSITDADSGLPEASLSTASNYCRSLDGERWPWCYTTDNYTRWDYCKLPDISCCK